MPRKAPLTSPLRRPAAAPKLIAILQLKEEPRLYGSDTPRSHGCGWEPRKEFSMLSVIPPELAKK